MLGPTPPLPQGDSALHRWARWVHQQIVSLRTCDTPNSSTQRTTRGVSVVTKPVRPQGGGNMNWRGVYDSSTRYVFGDVVEVEEDDLETGIYAGVWICVATSAGPSAEYPQWPIPATPVWRLIRHGHGVLHYKDRDDCTDKRIDLHGRPPEDDV